MTDRQKEITFICIIVLEFIPVRLEVLMSLNTVAFRDMMSCRMVNNDH